MLSDCCLSVCPVLSVTLVYCGQTVGWINMKLGMQVGLGPGHTELDGNPTPLPLICYGQVAGWIKIPFGREVGLSPGDIVLAPLPKRGRCPQFSATVCCGRMAGRTKMPLGREISPSPSDIMLDGDPTPPPPKGSGPPIFGPYLLWTNGWMGQFPLTW